MTTVRQLIAQLQRHPCPDETIAVAIWQMDDVILAGRDRDIVIANDMAALILEEIEDNHDASVGINWDTIDFWIDVFAEQRGEPCQ